MVKQVVHAVVDQPVRTDPKDYPITLTAKDVAEILDISLPKAYALMELPDFPLIRIGRHKKVNRDAFFNWVQKRQKIPARK